MKALLKENWFVMLGALPLVVVFLLWQLHLVGRDEVVQRQLFYCVFVYDIALVLLWIGKQHRALFEKEQWLRNIITIVACGVVILWTYKHKITFRLDVLLLFLCALYGIIYRQFIKPTVLTIVFFSFIVMRIVGLLWARYFDYGVRILFEEESIVFFLLVPVVLLGFSAKEVQQKAFIAICFKAFLLLLVANVVFYAFAISGSDKPFFSFVTLNKGYFNYLEVLFWTKFKHPSFLSWIILVVGGLGVLLWKKDKKLVTMPELLLYAVLLLCFVLMVQARVAIISYFIVIGFFVYYSVEKRLTKKLKYSLFVLLGVTFIGAVWYLITHTTYFGDPIRNQIYTTAFKAIEEGNIWIGNGSGYQRYILDGFVYYVHNDFVATLVDTGVLGLSILVGWLGCIVFSGDVLKQYLLLVFLPIMNTDVLFYVFECTYILIPIMLLLLFAPKYSYWQ